MFLFLQFKQMTKNLQIPKDANDYYYMKWLRARNYDLNKAMEMLQKQLEWRNTCKYLIGIMDFDVPGHLVKQVKWKQVGNDYEGRPGKGEIENYFQQIFYHKLSNL